MYLVNLLIHLSLFIVVIGQIAAAGSPSPTQCKSGRYYFDEDRIYTSPSLLASAPVPNIDISKYDFIRDYGTVSVDGGNGQAHLYVSKNGDVETKGTRLSMTRSIHYGKITVRMRAPVVPGTISTFITMSEVGDEIDFKMEGALPNQFETTAFSCDITEFITQDGVHKYPNGSAIDSFHDYTIDWQPDVIRWYIDGTLVRTWDKETSITVPTSPVKRWFPDTPSIVQLGIGYAGVSPDQGTNQWTKDRIQWGSQTQISVDYEYIDILCYGDTHVPMENDGQIGQGQEVHPNDHTEEVEPKDHSQVRPLTVHNEVNQHKDPESDPCHCCEQLENAGNLDNNNNERQLKDHNEVDQYKDPENDHCDCDEMFENARNLDDNINNGLSKPKPSNPEPSVSLSSSSEIENSSSSFCPIPVSMISLILIGFILV